MTSKATLRERIELDFVRKDCKTCASFREPNYCNHYPSCNIPEERARLFNEVISLPEIKEALELLELYRKGDITKVIHAGRAKFEPVIPEIEIDPHE